MSKILFGLVMVMTSDVWAGKSRFINFKSFVCPREEKALGVCLRDVVNTYIPRLAAGVPEYGVPSCEPLLVPEVTFKQDKGVISVVARYYELTVRGPSNMRITHIDVDKENSTITARLHVRELKIKGRLELTGQVMSVTIQEEGLCSGLYSDVDATVRIVLARKPRPSGPDALTCARLDVHFRVGAADVQLDNLFGGDQALGSMMNKWIKENWQKVSAELQPAVEDSLRDFLKPLADHAFASLDADEILE